MITPSISPQSDDVGRHYDELDEYYRDVWGEHMHHGLWVTGRESPQQAVLTLVERVAVDARIQPGMRVADIGCGYGATARHLAEHHEADVIGFTVSQAQRDYAVQRTPTRGTVDIRLCRWEENHLQEGSVDAAVSIECFTHIPDKAKFCHEIVRVLKPGSCAALAVWMCEPTPSPWRVRHLLEPICREGRLAGIGSADEYRVLFEQSGLEVVEFTDVGRQVRRTWRICAVRLLTRLLTSPRYWRAACDRSNTNRIFAWTLFRLLLGYWIGCVRYGLVVLRKPLAGGLTP